MGGSSLDERRRSLGKMDNLSNVMKFGVAVATRTADEIRIEFP
jgi:hypothetical protein